MKTLFDDGERISRATDWNSFIEQKATYSMQIDYLKRHMSNISEKNVVDCACGEGYGSDMISKNLLPNNLYSIDVDKELIEYCKKQYEKIQFICDDITQLNNMDNYIDIFFSNQTIEHLNAKDQKLALKKIYSKMNKEGYLMCAVPNKPVYQKYSKFNKYHLNELDYKNFKNLILTNRWKNVSFYGQKIPEYQQKSKIRKNLLLHKILSYLPKYIVMLLQKIFNPKLSIEDINIESYNYKNDSKYKILIAICQK
jgi:trans-aconitate methyltransferase